MVELENPPTIMFPGTPAFRPVFWTLFTAALLYGLVIFLATDIGGATL